MREVQVLKNDPQPGSDKARLGRAEGHPTEPNDGQDAAAGELAGRRLVSLVPSTTETLFALGVGAGVVGVTDYCTRPEVMPERVRRVGGPKTPDLELVRHLEPDLVFADREENRAADVEALRDWMRVEVADIRSVEEATCDISRVGHLVGTADTAAAFVGRIERELERLREAARPFRYAYLVWRDPWMAAGGETYIADLISQGGGVNVIAPRSRTHSRYPEISLASLTSLAPDVIMLPDEPYSFSAADVAEIARVLGGEWTDRCHLVPGDAYCWPGVRMVEGLAAYRRWLVRTA